MRGILHSLWIVCGLWNLEKRKNNNMFFLQTNLKTTKGTIHMGKHNVCMYVCMYVRMYVCMYVRTYVCTYIYIYKYIHIYINTYIHTYIHIYIYINTYIYIYINKNTYIYIYTVHNLILVPDILLVCSLVLRSSMGSHAVQRTIHSFRLIRRLEPMCDWQRLWGYATLQYGLDPIRTPHARHLECWWAQSKGSSHWKKYFGQLGR